MNTNSRIVQTPACEAINLTEKEKDVYSGAGWKLARFLDGSLLEFYDPMQHDIRETAKAAIATHWLQCSHCIGQSRTRYRMKCVPLKDMGNGRVKLLVFGERNWSGREHVKRIRYLPWHRITEMKI